MPSVPTVSPATGNSVPSYFIHTTSDHFVDTSGRTVLLRGVNLSGDSKFPAGTASHVLEGFWEGGESGDVSFIGRPFSLKEADVHLERLRGWGMNLIRYVICWEALEHAGPKKYDEEFIDFTIAVLKKCKEYGFKVFIDPHQDVWSRFSGGSGAPFWTLHACGLEPRNFTATGILIHNEHPDPKAPDPSSFGIMTWPTSYFRLPALTIFTLFWAGRDLAPKCIIDGVNIQDYLQSHLTDAYGYLADRIRDAGGLLDETVIGWENMNEPSEGLIGAGDLDECVPHQTLKKDNTPTPIQCLRLGMGKSQSVDFYSFSRMGPMRNGTVEIDPKGHIAWLDPKHESDGRNEKWGWTRGPDWKLGECIWAQHGVWDIASGNILKPDYFKWLETADNAVNPSIKGSKPARHKIDFLVDYWLPYWRAWAKRIRQSHPEAIHFIQPPLFSAPPGMTEEDIKGRAAYSPHFYDGLTMMTRHWNWFNSSTMPVMRKTIHPVRSFKAGEENIRTNFQEQLALFREDVHHSIGRYPIVLGETGTPFDVDDKQSYGLAEGGIHIGNYVPQQNALDASLNANDGTNIYGYAIWCYNPAHSWEHGDGFNNEDLSIWSSDDHTYRRHVKFEKLAKAAREGVLPSIVVGQQEVPSEEVAELQLEGDTKNRTAGAHDGGDADTSGPLPTMDGLPIPSALTQPTTTSYEFLVDGARAIYAFCRPYPVKTVGRPQSINYDIRNARFTLTISVDSSDAPIISAEEGDPSSTTEAEGSLPTEVYIPLTTFASPPTLVAIPAEEAVSADAEGAEGDASATGASKDKAKGRIGDASASPRPRDESTASSSGYDDSKRTHSVQEGVSRLHLSFAANRAKAAAGHSLHMTSDPALPLQIPDDVLDVDVDVDAGRIELKGQMLYWYYDVPARGQKTYKLTVQKRNPNLGAEHRSGPRSGSACTIM